MTNNQIKENEKMKKIITSAVALTAFIFSSANATEVDTLQQKTNVILIQKVRMLEAKVKQLQNLQLKNRLDIKRIKSRIELPDASVLASATESSASKKPKPNTILKNSTYDFENLYETTKECQAYKNESGNALKNKIFKRGSFVMILQKKKNRSLTHTGVWLNNDCFKPVNPDELKDGKLYKVNTYMANSRDKAGINGNIESVFMKNDLLFIVGEEKAKDGGTWYKIKNDGYINRRIVKRLKRSK